jgi:hypothetical protein
MTLEYRPWLVSGYGRSSHLQPSACVQPCSGSLEPEDRAASNDRCGPGGRLEAGGVVERRGLGRHGQGFDNRGRPRNLKSTGLTQNLVQL